MATSDDLRAVPEPMLARLTRELPRGDYIYEPKWDGFRCIAQRRNDDVELHSRHGRPLARYFPEVVAELRALASDWLTIDGELIIHDAGGSHFPALMARLHPAASRVERLSRETPAVFVAFDLLEHAGHWLLEAPFEHRRELLAEFVGRGGGALQLTPATRDPEEAMTWLERGGGAGIDGVVAKPPEMPYAPGARLMTKVKLEQTADCVIAGMRPVLGEAAVASLLLGLYDEEAVLHHVGVIVSFKRDQREELWRRLEPLAIPLERHPWREGYLTAGGPTGRLGGSAGRWTPEMELDWLPLEPAEVCEVAYEQLDGLRMRHPGRFRRWRPDREPHSCRLEQLTTPTPPA